MPIHLFWGEDEFLMEQSVNNLRSQVVDRQWKDFNYTQYSPQSKSSIEQALADINTPPVGNGGRLVYLPSSSLLGACSKEMLQQLESTLKTIPTSNALLITSTHKPDAKNKSVKLLVEYAQLKEFPLIPQWQTDALTRLVGTLADEVGVTMTFDACQLLAESVGNNTRLLYTQLEKLRLYAKGKAVNAQIVESLVLPNATNSLQLATAICTGNVSLALELVENLTRCNEPALKIVASLTTSFRRWFIVKLYVVAGCLDDTAIASSAELKNPKRLYFLKQEIANVPINQLQNALHVLLQLELMLKSGWDEKLALQTQIIKLCS